MKQTKEDILLIAGSKPSDKSDSKKGLKAFITILKDDWEALLILLLGIILTLYTTDRVHQQVVLQVNAAFKNECNEIALKINTRQHAQAQLLRSGVAFFAASGKVSRSDWKTFISTEKIEKNLPGILGVGYAVLIPPKLKNRHIQKIRKEGFPNYSIRPSGDRPLYTSIIYLEPFTGRNLKAFGYDMYTDSTRRKAMDAARDGDIAALTGKVILVQENKENVQNGVLMYVPVYKNGWPLKTVMQRRNALKGWVYSPYRMNDLMQGILGTRDILTEEKIHLKLYDEKIKTSSLLYESRSSADLKASNNQPSLSLIIPVIFNNKTWQLQFDYHGDSVSYFHNRTGIVLICGLALSLLLFLLTLSFLNTNHRAKRIADDLTYELQNSSDRYKNLFTLLDSIIDHIPGIVFLKDTQNNFIYVNRYMEEIHGRKKSEMEGHNVNEFYSKEESEQYYSADLAVLNSGIGNLNIEEKWESKNGIRFFNTSKIPFLNTEGQIVGIIGISMDISEKKQVETRIMKTLELLEKIASRVPGVLYQFKLNTDGSFKFPYVSEKVKDLFQVDPQLALENANSIFSLIHPDDLETLFETIQKSATDLKPWQHEFRIKIENGPTKMLFGNAIPQTEQDGSILWHGFITDITDLKLTENLFKLNESKLRVILDNSFDAIGVHINGFWDMCNNAALKLFGYDLKEELIGTPIINVIAPEERKRITEYIAQRKNNREAPSAYSTKGIRTDGSVFDLAVSLTTITHEDKNLVIVILRDISEHTLHEKEMTRLTSELRELSHHLQFIREEERSSIAKEIHDEFAQNLVALSMNAAFLKSSLKGKNKELIKLVDEQLHIADEVIKTSRTLFNTLHPSMLDELGLESAIRWYVKNHSKDSGIHFEIAINLQEEYIPKAINLVFFRVFQECFINLQQHSKATKGKVEIYKVDTNLTMVFSDNGIGFDVDAVNSSQSHGLLGIREMAYRLKGSFLIHSDSTGTTLELRIPLR